MSRGLSYLLRQRPQAMEAYFAFLRDNGTRLDPKTRALISVITKVSAQTEKGLVQYARKALDAGASADEILDALMMAFPALGLSRVVWALEVLLEHGVPGFEDAAGDAGGSGSGDDSTSEPGDDVELDVCALDALPEDRTVKYITEDLPLLLTRTADGVRAHKAFCSHQGMELMESGIRGRNVICRQHGWEFSMPEGRCLHGDRYALTELETDVRDGRVHVRWVY